MAQDPVSRPAEPLRRWSLQLPKDAPAARTARAAVDEWLGGREPELAGALRSVVTELVSNAIRYGRAPIQLSLEASGDHVRVEVTDAGPGRSSSRFQSRSPGRGLQIVAGLADRWGTSEDFSHAWCELAAPGPSRS